MKTSLPNILTGAGSLSSFNAHLKLHLRPPPSHPSSPHHPQPRLLPSTSGACPSSIASCITDGVCGNCLDQLDNAGVDWLGMSELGDCQDMTAYLDDAGYCADLVHGGHPASEDLFCGILTACEETVGNDDMVDDFFGPSDDVDCSALTSCQWEGKYDSFIGDGVCDHDLPGCYNSVVCGYDGGDCCEDKCRDGAYTECGSAGYHCMDPTSSDCEPDFFEQGTENACPLAPPEPEPVPTPTCASGESLYKVLLHDSWGDGWNDAELVVKDSTGHVKLTARLPDGSEGVEYVCLTNACFSVEVTSGDWGNECSWEVSEWEWEWEEARTRTKPYDAARELS